jgi:Tol biopolymer transport system component
MARSILNWPKAFFSGVSCLIVALAPITSSAPDPARICDGAEPISFSARPSHPRNGSKMFDPVAAATQQIVFMKPTNGALVPGPGTSYEIAIMNLDGSGFRQLTNDNKFRFLPHFSPDATKIAYMKYSAGQYASPNAIMDIAVYDLASDTETLVTHEGHEANATWSPDGTRIGYINVLQPTTIWTVAADGSNPTKVASASGAEDDLFWGDLAWSRDNWILFSVAQNVNGCFKVRTDKIRPNGSHRTQVSDGGPNCTPPGAEQSGDADPGWSWDSKTIYSSRGFPVPPANGPPGSTERKLYAFSSDAWFPGKPEMDLSLASEPSCIEGVPKGSPDGELVLLFRLCFDTPTPTGGIYLTDTAGSYRQFITEGFGADWSPKHSKGR